MSLTIYGMIALLIVGVGAALAVFCALGASLNRDKEE